jgi:hypothetical protein
MTISTAQSFSCITGTQDQFLSLFPHRFDFIHAPHPEPGQTPDWQTESRHQLSDRLIQQGGDLFGVRFGAKTNYETFDIDIKSPYHPRQDPLAIARMMERLEQLGIVACVILTSSYSQGIHIFFPFPTKLNSWEVAIAITTLLENGGFKIAPGQLEIFPNVRPYNTDGKPSLFNAHRLPMQAGSYLLDEDFQPTSGSQISFVHQWKMAQNKNDINARLLKRILKQSRRKTYRISGKADKFINDLNAEIEPGWTGQGQTNHLLGRIAMREYIFHHILHGGQPLENESLIKRMVEVARALPGYRDWCRHQHEIDDRAEEWARCIQKSKYFHYGESRGRYKRKTVEGVEGSGAGETSLIELPSENQRRKDVAREKIRQAIAHLLNSGSLPANSASRFHCLTNNYNIGGGTLYKHRDLWHPEFLLVENPPDPVLSEGAPFDCALGTSNGHNLTSLLSENASNRPSSNAFSDSEMPDQEAIASNTPTEKGSSDSEASEEAKTSDRMTLSDVKAWRAAAKEARAEASLAAERIRDEVFHKAQVAKMQQYLESGDPILRAEALAWAEINPGVLERDRGAGQRVSDRQKKTPLIERGG